jgi:oligopeptide transport system substrate-binding protein
MLRSFLVAATLGLLVVGCAKKTAAPDSTAAASPARQVLRIGNGGEPQDLDPQGISGVPEQKLMMALFEGLVTEDPQDLHPVPGVAASWTISEDGRVYTFHLRPEAKWSNGAPLTADDFVQSYRRMLSPTLASPYAYLIYNFMAGAKAYYDGKLKDFSQVGVKAVDDHTLQVTLQNRTPYLLKIMASHYAWTPVPTKVIAQFGPVDQKQTGWTKPGRIVGNGPFILQEWVPQKRIVVVRNPNYWDAKNVKLDEIDFYPTEESTVDERMFRTGQVDMTYELPNTKIDPYRRENPAALHIEPYLGVYFFRCNVARPPLNDKRVRQALALAIDRESIVRDVMRGGQQPAYAVSYPGVNGYTPAAHIAGTLADAKRLLAEAGYPDGKGFPSFELGYNSSENNRAVCEAVQQMWHKNLGINVTLANQEWKVYLDLQQTTNYTMQRSGWIADYVDPHVFLEIWETGNGNNNTNWSNAEYDRLLHLALEAKTDAARYSIYQKMDAILVDELPVIPVYYYTTVRALNPKLRGYYPTLLDDHPYKYLWFEP